MMRFPQDKIPAAAFLFEQARGMELGAYERDELRNSRLEMENPEIIAKSLMGSLFGQDADYCRSVYWALGKRCDRALVPFFKERLAVELARDAEAVYQILIALEDAGEEVFSPARSSRSVLDDEMNQADAVRYLEG